MSGTAEHPPSSVFLSIRAASLLHPLNHCQPSFESALPSPPLMFAMDDNLQHVAVIGFPVIKALLGQAGGDTDGVATVYYPHSPLRTHTHHKVLHSQECTTAILHW